MTAPSRPRLSRIVQALLVCAVLALILNPELRALFLLTNAFGFEVVGLLLALQLRALFYSVTPEIHRPVALACSLASRLGCLALVSYPGAVSFSLFNRLLCPVLITVSYGLSCQPSNNRWRGP